MEEKEVIQNAVEQQPEVKENPAPAGSSCGCKKISGDKRVFVISLLVAVITVLVYHCITYWYCKKECTPDVKTFRIIHQNDDTGCPPCPGKKQFGRPHHRDHFQNFRDRHHGRKNMKQNFRGRKSMERRNRQQQAPAPAESVDEQETAE